MGVTLGSFYRIYGNVEAPALGLIMKFSIFDNHGEEEDNIVSER